MAAWRINPYVTYDTLEQLRQTTGTPAGFVRALVLLAAAIVTEGTGSHGDTERDALSRLLFNSLLRIGRERPSDMLLDRVWHALTQVAEQFSEDRRVAYRRFKGLATRARRLKGDDALAMYKEILTRAPSTVIEIAADRDNEMELAWAHAVVLVWKEAWDKRDSGLLFETLHSAGVLQENFSGPGKLYDELSTDILHTSC